MISWLPWKMLLAARTQYLMMDQKELAGRTRFPAIDAWQGLDFLVEHCSISEQLNL